MRGLLQGGKGFAIGRASVFMGKKEFSFIERRMRRSTIKEWCNWIVEGVNPETRLLPGSSPWLNAVQCSGAWKEERIWGQVVKVIIA